MRTPRKRVKSLAASKPVGLWLTELKREIRSARARASLAVNQELVALYWRIGREISLRQKREGWGAAVVPRLANDLSLAFPDMRGFSPRNLMYMRAFAEAWPTKAIVQQLAAQLPWFHLCTLVDKLETRAERREAWLVARGVGHAD